MSLQLSLLLLHLLQLSLKPHVVQHVTWGEPGGQTGGGVGVLSPGGGGGVCVEGKQTDGQTDRHVVRPGSRGEGDWGIGERGC